MCYSRQKNNLMEGIGMDKERLIKLLKRLEFLEQSDEIRRIGSRAVHNAQEENRRLGIPNTYFINGYTYYELPDGRLSLEDPWDK